MLIAWAVHSVLIIGSARFLGMKYEDVEQKKKTSARKSFSSLVEYFPLFS